MAYAQIDRGSRTLAELFPTPANSYQKAIDSIAREALSGEDISARTDALARAFDIDPGIAQHEIDEAISDIRAA